MVDQTRRRVDPDNREAVLNRTAQLLTQDSQRSVGRLKEVREALDDMSFADILELKRMAEAELRDRWRYIRLPTPDLMDPRWLEKEGLLFHLAVYLQDHRES